MIKRKSKKIIFIIVLVVILILLGSGIFVWNNKYKKAVSFCENDCKYFHGWRFSSGGDIVWSLSSYDTKKECVNHCLDLNYFLRAFKK